MHRRPNLRQYQLFSLRRLPVNNPLGSLLKFRLHSQPLSPQISHLVNLPLSRVVPLHRNQRRLLLVSPPYHPAISPLIVLVLLQQLSRPFNQVSHPQSSQLLNLRNNLRVYHLLGPPHNPQENHPLSHQVNQREVLQFSPLQLHLKLRARNQPQARLQIQLVCQAKAQRHIRLVSPPLIRRRHQQNLPASAHLLSPVVLQVVIRQCPPQVHQQNAFQKVRRDTQLRADLPHLGRRPVNLLFGRKLCRKLKILGTPYRTPR